MTKNERSECSNRPRSTHDTSIHIRAYKKIHFNQFYFYSALLYVMTLFQFKFANFIKKTDKQTCASPSTLAFNILPQSCVWYADGLDILH